MLRNYFVIKGLTNCQERFISKTYFEINCSETLTLKTFHLPLLPTASHVMPQGKTRRRYCWPRRSVNGPNVTACMEGKQRLQHRMGLYLVAPVLASLKMSIPVSFPIIQLKYEVGNCFISRRFFHSNCFERPCRSSSG
jgi:hypothetical protein